MGIRKEIKGCIRKIYIAYRKSGRTHTHAVASICDYIKSMGHNYKFQTVETIVEGGHIYE